MGGASVTGVAVGPDPGWFGVAACAAVPEWRWLAALVSASWIRSASRAMAVGSRLPARDDDRRFGVGGGLGGGRYGSRPVGQPSPFGISYGPTTNRPSARPPWAMAALSIEPVRRCQRPRAATR